MVILIFDYPVQKQNVPKDGNRIYFGTLPRSVQKTRKKRKYYF